MVRLSLCSGGSWTELSNDVLTTGPVWGGVGVDSTGDKRAVVGVSSRILTAIGVASTGTPTTAPTPGTEEDKEYDSDSTVAVENTGAPSA